MTPFFLSRCLLFHMIKYDKQIYVLFKQTSVSYIIYMQYIRKSIPKFLSHSVAKVTEKKMRNQRSQHFSYSVIFSILLNALYFLQYVHGDEEITTRNAQNLMTSFPTETTVSGYPDEKLVQLRMFGGIPEKVNLIQISYNYNQLNLWILEI